MPSFDLVSKIDKSELHNAINMAVKIVQGRYDFKGSKAEIELTENESVIELKGEDGTKMKALLDVLSTQLAKRNIGLKCLEIGEVAPTGNRMMKQTIKLKNGIEKEMAKKITKIVKESNVKVNASIMDEKIRMVSKNIDDLQEIMQILRTNKDVTIELQMENMKRD